VLIEHAGVDVHARIVGEEFLLLRGAFVGGRIVGGAQRFAQRGFKFFEMFRERFREVLFLLGFLFVGQFLRFGFDLGSLFAHRVGISEGRSGAAVGAHAQEAGGDEQLAFFRIGERGLWVGLGRARKFIAGELFGDKLVERFVGIEGTDDVIAIFI